MKLKQLRERFFKNSNIELASAIVDANYDDAGVSAAQTSNMINNHDREVLELANGDYVICSAQTRIVQMTKSECKLNGVKVAITKCDSPYIGKVGIITGHDEESNKYTVENDGKIIGYYKPWHLELE